MDPNANLQEQERILCNRLRVRYGEPKPDAPRLRELRHALIEWLRGGGFEPDWVVCPHAATYYKQLRLYLAGGR